MKGTGVICGVKTINDKSVCVTIKSDKDGSDHEFVMREAALENLVAESKNAKWYLMLWDFYDFPVIFDTDTCVLQVNEEAENEI